MTAETERRAVECDAESQLLELRADRKRLSADRDDPTIALELHDVISRLRSCERQLGLNAKTSRFG